MKTIRNLAFAALAATLLFHGAGVEGVGVHAGPDRHVRSIYGVGAVAA
jgi:hypothetical protein